jgi:hypothetical protein
MDVIRQAIEALELPEDEVNNYVIAWAEEIKQVLK